MSHRDPMNFKILPNGMPDNLTPPRSYSELMGRTVVMIDLLVKRVLEGPDAKIERRNVEGQELLFLKCPIELEISDILALKVYAHQTRAMLNDYHHSMTEKGADNDPAAAQAVRAMLDRFGMPPIADNTEDDIPTGDGTDGTNN